MYVYMLCIEICFKWRMLYIEGCSSASGKTFCIEVEAFKFENGYIEIFSK